MCFTSSTQLFMPDTFTARPQPKQWSSHLFQFILNNTANLHSCASQYCHYRYCIACSLPQMKTPALNIWIVPDLSLCFSISPLCSPPGWRQELPLGGSAAAGGTDGFRRGRQPPPRGNECRSSVHQPPPATGLSASVPREKSGDNFLAAR